MTLIETDLPDLKLFELRAFGDDRGSFMEIHRQNRYADAGLDVTFVQDNLSRSSKGVLRGLHAQNPNPQGKLVCAVSGSIWDVAIDVREGSPTFGQWRGFTLSEENRHQLYIPPGFLHGFIVTSESAVVLYKVTAIYDPAGDFSVRWDDPDLNVQWPLAEGQEPLLSPKDTAALYLKDLPPGRLVQYAS